MHVCPSKYMSHICRYLQRPEDGMRYLGAGVTGVVNNLKMNAGN